MAFIKGENVSTFKNLSTLLVQVLIFLSLIQGCSGDEQDSNESMSSDTSIADDFLSEDELAKLLKFSNEMPLTLSGYFENYTWSWSSSMSRELGMQNIESNMKDFPELYQSTENVFEEWKNKGWKHSDQYSVDGNGNISVAIVKDYLDNKHLGKNIGAAYGISNQQLAHMIILSKGWERKFHESIQSRADMKVTE